MTCEKIERLLDTFPALFFCEYEEHIRKYVLKTSFYLPDGDMLTIFFRP